ncbi:uncharacterized protein LOC121726913 [Aricia agestis]|uniref:uncharacterized protein LOC121726913 n=1 Tax=Aricia agestis TaxID=91739 RepID=UPI001C206CDA|nr:uncharacterized protein LOC121726913 [Aricia agestis]
MFALHSRRLRRRLSGTTSSSARRQARERRLAEQTRAEGERIAKERREQRQKEKKEQQKKALAELASYAPWGRAGGGAPNARVRYSDLRAHGIYPEDELKGISPDRRGWSTTRRRRPLRLREDPQLFFADALRRAIDNDVRYRSTPDQQQAYRQILDDMVDKKKEALSKEIKHNLEDERKLNSMSGPWGKPGPGGTIWRNPRNVGLNFSKSMGWTDNDIFNKLKGDHKHKKSSLTLPEVKRVDDQDKSDKENQKPSVDKLPDIHKYANKKNDAEELIRIYSKKSPKKGKFVKRLSNGERVRKSVPDEESGEKKLTPEEAILHLTGGIELVPLLARRRRVGARTLPSSDVTRPPDQLCQWRDGTLTDMDYLRELKHQMRVKYERNQESRRDSAESARVHHTTWAALWGRPGHGAPQRGRYARSNLAQLLYVPPLNSQL